jgi:hypothetical protein
MKGTKRGDVAKVSHRGASRVLCLKNGSFRDWQSDENRTSLSDRFPDSRAMLRE